MESSGTVPPSLGLQATLPQWAFIAIIWVCVLVAGCLLIGRLYVRKKHMGGIKPDDYFLCSAFFFFVILAILQTIQVPSAYFISRLAIGLETDPLMATAQGNLYSRLEFPIIKDFWTELWTIKAAFLCLYYSILKDDKKYRLLWWFVVAFTLLAYVGCWIASIMVCVPLRTYFEFGKCFNPRGSMIAIIFSTAVDVLTDIMSKSTPN